MNRKLKLFIKLIIFICLFVLLLSVFNNVLKRKIAYTRMYDFSKQEENFDVLFFGSSHVYDGIYPMDLWNDYGIVSYNLGNNRERMIGTYYNMRMALRETKPKLAVIDTYLLHVTDKVQEGHEDALHEIFDGYEISDVKWEAIKELLGEDNLLENELGYLFPFTTYHARWNELTKDDFKFNPSTEKGAKIKIGIAEPRETLDYNSVPKYSGEENINMQYLRKTIEYLQSQGVEVLVTTLPYPASSETLPVIKYAEDICKDYNVRYLNFLQENNTDIDFDIDMYDETSHLNVSGARKITNYLGQFIRRYYNIPDQRNNEKYNFWNEDYKKHINTKLTNLKKQKTADKINNAIMLLKNEKDIKYKLTISSEKLEEINTKDEYIILKKLLKNIDNNYIINDSIFNSKHKDDNICLEINGEAIWYAI